VVYLAAPYGFDSALVVPAPSSVSTCDLTTMSHIPRMLQRNNSQLPRAA